MNSPSDDWKLWSTEKLEKFYSPSQWSKSHSADEIISHYVKITNNLTQKAREEIPKVQLDVQYDESQRAKFDVYGLDLPQDSVVIIYIHGGYWQELDKSVSGHMALPCHQNGFLTIVLQYSLAPKASVPEISEEVSRGIEKACDLAKKRGATRVYLMGWSAGVQLAMESLRLLETVESCLSLLKGVIGMSGIYDLQPLVNTYVNKHLKLNRSTAKKLSPIKYIYKLTDKWNSLQFFILIGSEESPEFIRQSDELHKELLKNSFTSRFEIIPNKDHFSLVEDLSSDNSDITRSIFDFIETSRY